MTDNLINTNYYNKIAAPNYSSVNSGKSAISNFSSLLQNAVNTIDNKKTGNNSMDTIFERAASQFSVPVNLLKAVAKNESNFDAKAVSRCGAQGVMQLMPGTAKSLGVQDPLDAEQNIMGGAKYLSQMLDRYDGDAKLALAAYNAGSGNVAKYGGIPPFKETQAYVSRVMNDADGDISAPTTQLSSLNSGLGSAYTAQLPSLDSILGSASTAQLPSLDSLLSSVSTAGGLSGTTNSADTGFTYNDYLSFLQLYLVQMQSNASQAMSSDLSSFITSDI